MNRLVSRRGSEFYEDGTKPGLNFRVSVYPFAGAKANPMGRIHRTGRVVLSPVNGDGHVAGAVEHRTRRSRTAPAHTVCLRHHRRGGLHLAFDFWCDGRSPRLTCQSSALAGGCLGCDDDHRHFGHPTRLEFLAGAAVDPTPGIFFHANGEPYDSNCFFPITQHSGRVWSRPRRRDVWLDVRLLGDQRAECRRPPCGRDTATP